MANGGEKKDDFYAVLGLKKECTASELRNAYKKLALRWHPDRCSASGNSKFVEEAKKKFQAIQQAYSVLLDENKRFLYDVGVYDSDDDENGMGDFLKEMAVMMSQTKPNGGGEETFEELKQLFEDMFQDGTVTFGYNSSYCESSAFSSSHYSESSSSSSKRSSAEMNHGLGNENINNSSSFAAHFRSFRVGTGGAATGYDGGEESKMRSSRRSKRSPVWQETKGFS